MNLDLASFRFLIRDRGSSFIASFDEIFTTEGLDIVTTPVAAPRANAICERWIGSARRELLDHTLIWNRRQLHQLLTDYVDHYNRHRPHRSRNQRAPDHPDHDRPEPADLARIAKLRPIEFAAPGRRVR